MPLCRAAQTSVRSAAVRCVVLGVALTQWLMWLQRLLDADVDRTGNAGPPVVDTTMRMSLSEGFSEDFHNPLAGQHVRLRRSLAFAAQHRLHKHMAGVSIRAAVCRCYCRRCWAAAISLPPIAPGNGACAAAAIVRIRSRG